MTSDMWFKLYEPKSLSEIVGQIELVNAFKIYVKDRHIPNITIAGPPGIGKTLLMKCFAHDLGFCEFDEDGKQIDLIPGQFYLFDSSSDRSINTVRGTIKRLSQLPTLEGMPRLIVLDEFNYEADAQGAMRVLMQECSSNVRFILLSNDPTNIIDPIISRCPLKYAQPLTINDAKEIVKRIQKKKEFKITDEAIEILYKLTNGDIRQFINTLQDSCIISNYNVLPQHVQISIVDVQVAKSIIEASIINPQQAKDVMVTVYTKTRNAELIIGKLYEATYLVKLSDNIVENEIMLRRLRDRIAEVDFRISHTVNKLVHLDSIINYIQLLKFIPLKCPKVR